MGGPYYVRALNGDDSANGLTFADGWSNFQKAADTLSAGEEAYICADGIHSPSATIDFDTNTGTPSSNIIFRGANSVGVIDGTQPIVSGGGLPASQNLVAMELGSGYDRFVNIRFTAGKLYNIDLNVTSLLTFCDCRIDNASSYGFRAIAGNCEVFIINSEVDNNGDHGIGSTSTNRGRYFVYGCDVHDNNSHGIFASLELVVFGCNIYNNNGSGIYMANADMIVRTVASNVLYNNADDGIYLDTAWNVEVQMYNNIMVNNGGVGLNTNTANVSAIFPYLDYNCSYNNTGGHIDTGGSIPGFNNVEDDPLFTSTTSGSEDFTLQTGSPCSNVGFGYSGI